MTKEEIINKHVSSERRVSDFNQAPPYDFKYMSLPSARVAMDEYAKRQAIAFIEWAIDNEMVEPVGYGSDSVKLISGKSEEIIYNQFIEQQNK